MSDSFASLVDEYTPVAIDLLSAQSTEVLARRARGNPAEVEQRAKDFGAFESQLVLGLDVPEPGAYIESKLGVLFQGRDDGEIEHGPSELVDGRGLIAFEGSGHGSSTPPEPKSSDPFSGPSLACALSVSLTLTPRFSLARCKELSRNCLVEVFEGARQAEDPETLGASDREPVKIASTCGLWQRVPY